MPSQGPLFATDGDNDNAAGTIAWTDPDNVVSSNDTRATAALTVVDPETQYLTTRAYGFSIPANSTIDGIEVLIERSSASAMHNVTDKDVQLIKGGVIGGTDLANEIDFWNVTTDTTVTYGSPTQLWGQTWTVADINAADFGATIRAQLANGTTPSARVDSIAITVHYSPAAADGFPWPPIVQPYFARPQVVAYGG